jgi:prophage tail gpP-like protein
MASDSDLERPDGIKDKGAVLIVDSRKYSGWKSVRVTRSIESLAGSFALGVNDRWGDEEFWPIAEEDPCRVEIYGVAVVDGYVDKRSLSASADSRTLAYSGRDRAAALVDCSTTPEMWTAYKKLDVAAFIAYIAGQLGIHVSVQPGLVFREVPRFVVSPGDTHFDVIRRAVTDQSVLIVSDGDGGIVLTRSGAGRATSLIEGQNILTASVEYDGADRYRRYVIAGQSAGTDEAHGAATSVLAEATDPGVHRAHRSLFIRPDKGNSEEGARKRADWEARIRAARAETVTVTVHGWTQPSGELWAPNALAYVRAPRMIGVDGDLLISQVEYSIGDGGTVTQLRLVRPDAFTPEPVTATVRESGGRWKELDDGGR